MIRTSLNRLVADNSGAGATEFALCLPFLLLLFVGGYQLSDAISAYRKVTAVSRTVADLTARTATTNNAELDDILNASVQVLSPYKVSDASLTVSQIKIDNALVSTVDWSRGKNTAALTTGSAYTLPTAIKTANTWLIVAEVNYTYVPKIASTLIGPIPMRDKIVMNPRGSTFITYAP